MDSHPQIHRKAKTYPLPIPSRHQDHTSDISTPTNISTRRQPDLAPKEHQTTETRKQRANGTKDHQATRNPNHQGSRKRREQETGRALDQEQHTQYPVHSPTPSNPRHPTKNQRTPIYLSARHRTTDLVPTASQQLPPTTIKVHIHQQPRSTRFTNQQA
jgi:hypothetical protein